jgi:hypothetical protein
MVNILDVLETVTTLRSTPSRKIAEASKLQSEAETKPAEVEAAASRASAEAGPSEPADEQPSEFKEKATEEEVIEQSLPEKTPASGPEALKENIEYIIRHASGKKLSHPVLEGKPNANHVRARISYSRTQQLHNMDIITQCSK